MPNSYRKTGYLNSPKQTRSPKSWLFLDTESWITKITDEYTLLPLRLGVAIYVRYRNDLTIKTRIVYQFTTGLDMVNFLLSCLSKKETLYIIGHNIAHDIMVLNLIHHLKEIGCETTPPILNHRLFIWRGSIANKQFVFLDTANYSITSVAQLGKDLGYAKLEISFENTTDEELFVYCQRDVEICERFIFEYIKFIDNNNLGSFTLSLASQALSCFRYRFMEQPIFIHNHKTLLQLERDSYHGGRVECFYIGTKTNEQHTYLDINSMYPYIMKTEELPYAPLGFYTNPTLDALQKALQTHYVIASVELETIDNAYPKIQNGKLIFPIGHYHTVLHSSELRQAIRSKSIVRVLAMGVYLKAYLFTDYINFFYKLKQKATEESNSTYRLMAKLYLNSLYGKFGQQNVVRTKIAGAFPDLITRYGGYNDVAKYHFQEFIWFGDGYREIKQGEAYHSSPVLAGAITAGARMLLYRYYSECGRNNCLYMDTDSLIVNNIGLAKLSQYIDPLELGKLKIEDQSTRLRIKAPKDYLFGSKKRRKGIPDKAIRQDINEWLVDDWLGVKTWLANGGNETPSIKKIVKHINYIYNKGNVDSDTGYITPYSLDE